MLLSRLRAGSMPQRPSAIGPASPFGPNVFSTPWAPGAKERSANLSSLRSSEGCPSPAHSSFFKEGLADTDVRTLDYLGLAERTHVGQANFSSGASNGANVTSTSALPPFLTDLASYNRSLSRFRSYSVNAKEKYAEDEDDDMTGASHESGLHSGSMTPSAASAAAALAATQAQIHQHNLAVQAFASQASASRPRARTAGVLDSPAHGFGRSYLSTPSRINPGYAGPNFPHAYGGEDRELSDSMGMLHIAQQQTAPTAEPSDENALERPTRALWLGSIPASTTLSSLQAIFAQFGKIESTRVLLQKNCGFVNYESVDPAIRARAMLNGTEIFPGAGPVRIGFAKAPSMSSGGLILPGAFPSLSSEMQGNISNSDLPQASDRAVSGSRIGQQVEGPTQAVAAVPRLSEIQNEILRLSEQLGANDHDLSSVAHSVQKAVNYVAVKSDISAILEPGHSRLHDAPKLREIRKRIDNNAISQAETEEIAIAMLPEIAELSSDYLGNTVVQKLFDFCSEQTKEAMLSFIGPHLADIGTHKNGTWAAQKIIDVAKTPKQMSMITESLRPHAAALFLDQYGNYVLQCCLRFGSPWNDFLFETMLSCLWEIAQGRFGARAMRACLESHHATKNQQRVLASAIALHGVSLASNSNGALLLTWLLDTCTFPQRRSILAPRLISCLEQLCTNKIAYLTVLKLLNQRNEPEARELLLQALFFSNDSRLLRSILGDPICGATLVFKVLTIPFFDHTTRVGVTKAVRSALLSMKIHSSQGYKRLMDEVGLSARNPNKNEREQTASLNPFLERTKVGNHNDGASNMLSMDQQNGGQYTNVAAPYGGLDGPHMYDHYNMGSPIFTPPLTNTHSVPFSNSMVANARTLSPVNMFSSYPMSGSFDGLPSLAIPSRAQQPPVTSSPMVQGAGLPPPGVSLIQGFQGYNHLPLYPQHVSPQTSNGRRGRVGSHCIPLEERLLS